VIDLVVIIAYLAGMVGLGAYFSRSQRSVREYFVSGKSMPWWAIAGSIIATETSAITFISVPGFAFEKNFSFLQLAFGYLIGRLVVVTIFMPLYFKRDALTIYQTVGDWFGDRVKRVVAGLFLLTRTLADGFRLFSTGLALTAFLATMPSVGALQRWAPTWLDPNASLLAFCVVAMGVTTIVYTCLGGMSAVIWTDAVQLLVYLIGAFVATWTLLELIPGGFQETFSAAMIAGKLQVFDFSPDVTKSYTFWSGVVGGTFLTASTHGADQLIVQRYLCTDKLNRARLALLVEGAAVFAQFALFLFIGTLLWTFYTRHAVGELQAIAVNGKPAADRVFPQFIVTHLPSGVIGLTVAAVCAAAMSTLSSSLNASAATTMADFYIPLTGGARGERKYLRMSRYFTAFWGVAQVGCGLAAVKISKSLIDEALAVASFSNGLILGVFFLGVFGKRIGEKAALFGFCIGAGLLTYIKVFTGVSWQWYVLLGSLTTFGAGAGFHFFYSNRPIMKSE
jgi:Na+/proline symporter